MSACELSVQRTVPVEEQCRHLLTALRTNLQEVANENHKISKQLMRSNIFYHYQLNLIYNINYFQDFINYMTYNDDPSDVFDIYSIKVRALNLLTYINQKVISRSYSFMRVCNVCAWILWACMWNISFS